MVKTNFWDRKTMILGNHNLWPLEIYNGQSKHHCIKLDGIFHLIRKGLQQVSLRMDWLQCQSTRGKWRPWRIWSERVYYRSVSGRVDYTVGGRDLGVSDQKGSTIGQSHDGWITLSIQSWEVETLAYLLAWDCWPSHPSLPLLITPTTVQWPDESVHIKGPPLSPWKIYGQHTRLVQKLLTHMHLNMQSLA